MPASNRSLRQPLSGLVSLIPFFGALLWFLCSAAGRAINSATVPSALVAVQVYRVAGIFFLFPYLSYGALPAGFAWPACVGDTVTGLAAPFVALALLRRHRGSSPPGCGMEPLWNPRPFRGPGYGHPLQGAHPGHVPPISRSPFCGAPARDPDTHTLAPKPRYKPQGARRPCLTFHSRIGFPRLQLTGLSNDTRSPGWDHPLSAPAAIPRTIWRWRAT